MLDNRLSTLQQEWVTLQTQFDSYEKCALGIKLFSIFCCIVLIGVLNTFIGAIIVVGIIWLQDAIWKTFQSRIGQRLETIESAIKDCQTNENIDAADLGMQFNSAWLTTRPNALGLLCEYLKQALKPTVAFPHVLLLATVVVMWFFHI